jgi:UrcA family protein
MSRIIMFAAILFAAVAMSGTAHAAGRPAWDMSGAYVLYLKDFNLARADDRAALRIGIDKVARKSCRADATLRRRLRCQDEFKARAFAQLSPLVREAYVLAER